MKPRAVKLSKTFNDKLVEQIDYGEQRFGARVAEEKKERVLAIIENLLANNPAIKRPHPALGLVVSGPDISKRRDDVVVGEHPSDCRGHQAEGEAVHVLAVHRIDGVRGDDDAVVTVRGLEAAA